MLLSYLDLFNGVEIRSQNRGFLAFIVMVEVFEQRRLN